MIDERKILFGCGDPDLRAGPAIWGSGWRARSASDSLGFWTPLFAKIIGNPWENQRFGAPSAPDFWRFGHPLFAKMLEILGKINVSAREARPIFLGFGHPFFAKMLEILGKSTFRRAKRAGFFGVLGTPFGTSTSKNREILGRVDSLESGTILFRDPAS